MARPEPTNTVCGAVEPIIGKIIEHKAERESPPHKGNIKGPKRIGGPGNRKGHTAHQSPGNCAPQTKSKRRQRIAGFIFLWGSALRPDHLNDDQKHEERHGIVNWARQLFHGFVFGSSREKPSTMFT